MRTFLVTVSAALAAAALLAVVTDPQIIAPAKASVSTVSKVGVKGDRLDIGRPRNCSGEGADAAREQNCVRSPAPAKSAPLGRSVVVELAHSARAAS
jgi:hypothetical protein